MQGHDASSNVILLHNRTPQRLLIEGRDQQLLVLAPLAERAVEEALLAPFDLTDLVRRGLVSAQTQRDAATNAFFESAMSWIFTALFFWIVVGFSISQDYPAARPWYWGGGAVIILGAIAALLIFSWRAWTVVVRGLAQAFSLALILLFGAGGPILAVYFFGDGSALLAQAPSLALLGRMLQVVLIVAASLLPALLYYLFDRHQLGTLRQRFYREIFRLDPTLETMQDVSAKYGRQVAEVYGPEGEASEGRLIRGTRWPLIVTTLVVTLGWMLTLLPAGPVLLAEQPTDLLALLRPHPTAVTFGFLGAYFFGLNMILRRYMRGDLRPKAYSHITARIVVVLILTWIVGILLPPSSPTALLIAFVIGVFPETGWIYIRESLQHLQFGRVIPTLEDNLPLTTLEEIDVYDRARLFEEGVTNIESLAHHDLIDLILSTRIPVPRLVDWFDQAILYLHLKVEKSESEAFHEARARLRRYGVRTATDLERAYLAQQQRAAADQTDADQRVLKLLDAADAAPPYRVQTILDTMQQSEWIDYIRQWRQSAQVEEMRVTAPAPPVTPIRHAPETSSPSVPVEQEV